MLDLGKENRQPAGQFSSFDGEVQTTRSPIEQANPERRFQLFNLPAQGRLRNVERFGRLSKTSGPGDFREGDQLSQIEKGDNKKVSLDRIIIFELFMIRLQMIGMQETKEFTWFSSVNTTSVYCGS
jgi:hypothetical protein